jgi:hypothetical protein
MTQVAAATDRLDETVRAELKRADKSLIWENRQLTAEGLARLSAHPSLTKQIVHLSLAKNRLTKLVFDDSGTNNNNGILPTSSNGPLSPRGTDAPTGKCSWPSVEWLDLSGNTELYVFSGLLALQSTLKTLKLSANAFLKVPHEVWLYVPPHLYAPMYLLRDRFFNTNDDER